MKQEIEQEKVAYLIHESDMARCDRNYRRLWITLNGVLAMIATAIIIGVFRNETCKRSVN